MTVSKDEVLERVRLLQSSGRSTVLVAIDGGGGAGKTFLADWMTGELGAGVVHVDDFGRPGLPYDAWDWDRLKQQVLDPLSDDRPARFQRYDWDSDRLDDWVEVDAGGVVIIEGVTVTRTQLGDPWDLKIWVESPYDVRLARGVARDGTYKRDEWIERWMPEDARYIAEQDPISRADAVVLGYEPD